MPGSITSSKSLEKQQTRKATKPALLTNMKENNAMRSYGCSPHARGASAVPMVAAVLGAVVQTAPALLLEGAIESAMVSSGVPRVELAIARGVQGEGLAVPANAVNATLAALAGAAPVSLYMLT